VIAKISQELALDVPGAVPGATTETEYYDYPGPKDTWLASLEPDANTSGSNYYWRQISDVTGYLAKEDLVSGKTRWATQNIAVDNSLSAKFKAVIEDHKKIELESTGDLKEQMADADGDGVADSKWIGLEDVTSGKGEPVYAAIRIIDNGGMINVNTAYKFDANEVPLIRERVDGSSQLQINLMALAGRPNDPPPTATDEENLRKERTGWPDSGIDQTDLDKYSEDVVWHYDSPDGKYTPFDISDELELRNRFLLNQQYIDTRIENLWTNSFASSYYLKVPVDKDSDLDKWFLKAGPGMTSVDDNYSYRHIATTYNMDRIIDPCGLKMLNINPDPNKLDLKPGDYSETLSREKARDIYEQLVKSVRSDLSDAARQRKRTVAQLAVNIVDFRDKDTDVTSLNLATLDGEFAGQDEFYYGFEPYPVITKVGIYIDPCDPTVNQNYYAVELFMPFDVQDMKLDDFWLLVTDVNDDIADMNQVVKERIGLNDLAPLGMSKDDYAVIFNAASPNMPIDTANTLELEVPGFVLSSGYQRLKQPGGSGEPGPINADAVDAHNVTLMREVKTETGQSRSIFVDRQLVYKNWVRWNNNDVTRYYERDFHIEDNPWWYVVYPGLVRATTITNMGARDRYLGQEPTPRPSIDISLPWNDVDGRLELVTAGDIARVWTVGPKDYLYDPQDANDAFESGGIFDPNTVKPAEANDVNGIFAGYSSYTRTVSEKLKFASMDPQLDLEELIRLNLADPHYRNLFQYITVFDPCSDNIDNDGDGQIDEGDTVGPELKVPGRININTAPWYVIAQLPWMRPDIARAIVAYRDKSEIDIGAGTLNYGSDPCMGRFVEIDKQINPRFRSEDIREEAGFESIGELAMVLNNSVDDDYSMRYYTLKVGEAGCKDLDLDDFPDLTNYDKSGDEAVDDFEERDVIFSRISNLVTVRSDVFTAYILVRIGADGPQKRVIAILDRSDVYSGDGRVKVVALHPVPDPR